MRFVASEHSFLAKYKDFQVIQHANKSKVRTGPKAKKYFLFQIRENKNLMKVYRILKDRQHQVNEEKI